MGDSHFCAFTGHRAAKLPWGFNDQSPDALKLRVRINDVVEAVCCSGVRGFLCGMASGCDLYFAQSVLEQKQTFPDITLEAAIPYPGQADRWPWAEQQKYRSILAQCDKTTVFHTEYSRLAMLERNRYMVDNSGILIVCYDGHPGGTLNTMRYAYSLDREIIQIPVIIES